jgi:hypothetical protein
MRRRRAGIVFLALMLVAGLAAGLAQPGSTGKCNRPHPCTTTTVTIPTSTVPPAPAPSGAPYDAASAWNAPIPAGAPTDPRSLAFMTAIADNGLPLTSDTAQYTIAVYEFDASTPLVSVRGSGFYSTYDNGDDSRVGHGSPWTELLPIPATAQAPPGTDGQIVLIDRERGIEYGLWQFARRSDGSVTATNAYRYHTTAGYYGRFADGLAGRGAGMPYLAGLVRPWELAQGRIDHALAFAYDSPSAAFVYPASKSDGGKFHGVSGLDLPEGSRLQLDPALTETDFDRFGLSEPARVIARALQTYGMYVVDHSGSSKVYVEYSGTAGSVSRDALSRIPWNEFRVVS